MRVFALRVDFCPGASYPAHPSCCGHGTTAHHPAAQPFPDELPGPARRDSTLPEDAETSFFDTLRSADGEAGTWRKRHGWSPMPAAAACWTCRLQKPCREQQLDMQHAQCIPPPGQWGAQPHLSILVRGASVTGHRVGRFAAICGGGQQSFLQLLLRQIAVAPVQHRLLRAPAGSMPRCRPHRQGLAQAGQLNCLVR